MRPPNLSYHAEAYAAVERIILRAGCGAATVRAVAQEGGLSASTVRYHFRNQSHLLACAFAAVDDHFSHQLGGLQGQHRRAVAARQGPVPVGDAVAVLAVHVPTHGVGLERLRLLHAYKAWARHDWDTAITIAGFDDRLLGLCRGVLLGLGVPPVQSRRQARILRAILTGLAEEVVTLADPPEGERDLGLPDRLTDRGVRTILTEHLTHVMTGHVAAVPVDRAG